jgi:glycerol-3-phosphate dehydrogenase
LIPNFFPRTSRIVIRTDHLADAGSHVLLWSRSVEVVNSLNTTHRNPKYLKDHLFSSSINAIGPEFPSKDVITSMNVVIFAIPTQNLRQVGSPRSGGVVLISITGASSSKLMRFSIMNRFLYSSL